MTNLFLSGLWGYQIRLYNVHLLLDAFINKVAEGSLLTGFFYPFSKQSLFSLHQRTCHDNQLFCPNHQSLLITAGQKFCSVDQLISAHDITPGGQYKSSLDGESVSLQGFCRWFYHLHLGLIELSCLSLTLLSHVKYSLEIALKVWLIICAILLLLLCFCLPNSKGQLINYCFLIFISTFSHS